MPLPDDTAEFAVEAHRLTKRFHVRGKWFARRPRQARTVTAVHEASFKLKRGEIFGLVGPNGAGKTTLIKLLTTLLLPTEGAATIAGYDVARHPHRVRQIVGLVTANERSFYWRLTGRQNMQFFADLYQLTGAERHRWIDELFEILGLAAIADKRFDAYSTGQRQRLAIARGLLTKPAILFMDEPTKGVDPVGARELIKFVRDSVVDLWHPTILVTSHNLVEIEKLCGRIAMMQGGRITAMGKLDELRGKAGAPNLYRLTVRGVDDAQATRVVDEAGLTTPLKIDCSNGAARIEVNVGQEPDALARLLRGLVEAGGDIMQCAEVKASLDDVYHKLVDDAGGPEPAPGEG